MHHQDTEYVGFWLRFAAAIIDTVILFVIIAPLLTIVYGPAYWLSERFIAGPADLLISWVFPAVAYIALWAIRGQTPGKMMIGARIVDARTGGRIGLGKAVIRYIGSFASFVVLCIGYIWVGFDPKKQGWHDHLAGTVVVRNVR